MTRIRPLWLGVLVLLAGLAEAAEAPGVPGKVEAVTLYRGQALVTRRVPVAAGEGQMELIVSNLPLHVVPDSLFAETTDGIEVRAVRFRTRAVGEEPREEVRQLDEQIQAVNDRVARNTKLQELVASRLKFLDKLETFTAPTAKTELSKGVLNVDSLKQIALFSFEERQKAADESLKLATEARTLGKELSLLQRKRKELTAGSSETVREAILFLEKQGAGKAEIKLSYLVTQAGWSPAYNFRAAQDGKETAVEYNALIRQMSGEDWTGVKLTLSTASPALSAQGPGLAPFRVALTQRGGKGEADRRVYARRFQESLSRRREAEQQQRGAQVLADNRSYNWKMNLAANEVQDIELALDQDALQTIVGEPAAAGDVTSATYELDTAVSLASRSDQQMLRIADLKLPSRLYHVATPILTSYVYREGELTNAGIDALLAGPVSVYLDGRFVGRGEIPTVARGETFVMGFGAEPQLRARRELVEKTEGVQGGNREITTQYRLVLENFKDTAVDVRLLDRIPVAERAGDVRVTLDEEMMKAKLSADPLYVRLEKPRGILRWDVSVPARSSGEKAHVVEYGYKLEFQRDLHFTTPVPAQAGELRDEFEDMQKKRSLK